MRPYCQKISRRIPTRSSLWNTHYSLGPSLSPAWPAEWTRISSWYRPPPLSYRTGLAIRRKSGRAAGFPPTLAAGHRQIPACRAAPSPAWKVEQTCRCSYRKRFFTRATTASRWRGLHRNCPGTRRSPPCKPLVASVRSPQRFRTLRCRRSCLMGSSRIRSGQRRTSKGRFRSRTSTARTVCSRSSNSWRITQALPSTAGITSITARFWTSPPIPANLLIRAGRQAKVQKTGYSREVNESPLDQEFSVDK